VFFIEHYKVHCALVADSLLMVVVVVHKMLHWAKQKKI
jgi:hypothetical protein